MPQSSQISFDGILAEAQHRSPPETKETVLGLVGLGSAGRPSCAPHHYVYRASLAYTRCTHNTTSFSSLAMGPHLR
jgi:hypothetical protein